MAPGIESDWKHSAPENIEQSLTKHFTKLADELEALNQTYQQLQEDQYLQEINNLTNLGEAALQAEKHWRKNEGTYQFDDIRNFDKLEYSAQIIIKTLRESNEEYSEEIKSVKEAAEEKIQKEGIRSMQGDKNLDYAIHRYQEALKETQKIDEIDIDWPENLINWEEVQT